MAAGEITTLTELVDKVESSGDINELMNDPAAQFGTGDIPYEGARILPERQVPENMYKETQVKYRSFLANAGSYYSPAQMSPTGQLVGSFNVELGKTDQADQLTAQDYKNLMALLNRKLSREALLAVIRWMDTHILRPHLDLNEKYRWDAIVKAEVRRVGSNGYLEVVDYPNPPGHRPPPISGGTVAAPAGWYDRTGAYDPFEDIFAILDLMDRAGYRCNRILTGGRKLLSVLGKNPESRDRAARITVTDGGIISARPGRATTSQINAVLDEEGAPPIEIYSKTYHTRETGERTFIPDDTLVFLASTGLTESIDLGERGVIELENTLGYFGIGTPADAYQPGRVVNTEIQTRYPGGWYAEGIQIGLPVLLHPQGIAVLKIAAPTAV